jgi:nucleotide-binding universal stress UspA family protein
VATRRLHAFDRILVPVSDRAACDEAMTVACGVAAEHGASITILTAVEVPRDLPLDAHMPEEEVSAHRLLAEAQAIAELYGVNARVRVVRAREPPAHAAGRRLPARRSGDRRLEA